MEEQEQNTPPPNGREHIGRYEVLDRVGSGAMADIYKARDPDIDRIVAVKVLKETLNDEDDLERFVREAKAAGALTHPGIVTIHDVGRLEGRPYFTMELIEGPTLEDLMASQRRLSDRKVIEIAIALAEALDYAHRNHVVHRDIKPSNVLFVPGSLRPKIADFGIARLEATEQSLMTRDSAVIGTPRYMSPEQALGSPLDGRSDLFSLGVVLFELLTGVKAFNAPTTTSLLIQIARERPQSFRDVEHEVPVGLQRIVRKLLSKKPERRFQTGRELAEALRRELNVAIEREEDAARNRYVPLRVRWALTMGLAIALVLGACIVTVVTYQSKLIRSQVEDAGGTLARFVAAEAAIPVLGEDWVRLETFVAEADRRETFEYLAIYDHRDTLRAATHPDLDVGATADAPGEVGGVRVTERLLPDGTPVIDFETDILFQNTRVGRIHLGLGKAGYLSVMHTTWWLMALLAAVTLTACVAMFYALGGVLSRPLRTLARSMALFAQGDYDHRPSSVRKDEVGELYNAFNQLADVIQQRLSTDEVTKEQTQLPEVTRALVDAPADDTFVLRPEQS